MPVVPAVLIALEEDRVAARDEEPRGGVTREVIVDAEGLSVELVARGRLRRGTLEP